MFGSTNLRIPLSDAESLVLKCAKELFDNSDSGDKTLGLMKMAFDWLALCLLFLK